MNALPNPDRSNLIELVGQAWFARLLSNFVRHVDFSGECWLWTGAVTMTGYGSFRVHPIGKTWQAHRFAFEALVGPVPPGFQRDHLCRVKLCVRPEHLQAVTQEVNLRRRVTVGSTVCPKGHERPAGTRCRECRAATVARFYSAHPEANAKYAQARARKRGEAA